MFALEADATVHAALEAMRETRNHLAVLTDDGAVLGVITLSDVLRRLFPPADDGRRLTAGANSRAAGSSDGPGRTVGQSSRR